jgi:hypothetical protein
MMHNALKLAVLAVSLLFFAAFSFAGVTVTVTSPGNGATVTSPMTLKAWASGSTGITGWYVYVDNSVAWHTAGPTASISPTLTLSSGGHNVHLRAWQSNGEFGDADWVPIRYLYRSFGRNQLSLLYRRAAIGYVTPMRDGMNLVAKEFVASQNPEDPGVLLLSRFAGAAVELSDAVLTNP